MDVDNYDWLIPIVLASAGEIEVQEPAALRRRIVDAVQDIARAHGSLGTGRETSEAGNLASKGDLRSRAIRGRTD